MSQQKRRLEIVEKVYESRKLDSELTQQIGREAITGQICKFAESTERKVRRNDMDEMVSEDSDEDQAIIKYKQKLREVKSQFGQGN